MKRFLPVVILLLISLSTAQAALIDVGPQVNTYTGNTRGFWFTAPTDFVITGLGLPTDASTDNFDVAVLRLNDIPPIFSAETSSFDTLFLSRDNTGSGLLSTNISVSAGDVIGILGSRGAGSTNSYGSYEYQSNILGFDVILTRFLMQGDLRNDDPIDIGVSSEPNYHIGRVLVNVSAVPLPAAAWLFISGILGLIGFNKRRQAAK